MMRICWMCEHVVYSLAERDWSEVTPGSDFYLSCGKGHWTFDAFRDGLEQFREKLETAERCVDFVNRDKSGERVTP